MCAYEVLLSLEVKGSQKLWSYLYKSRYTGYLGCEGGFVFDCFGV